MSSQSVIGRGSVVRGNVRGEGSLEILGRLEGDVSVTGDVVVGESGAVRGDVSGNRISVHGAVQGALRGREAVLIERGGKVIGDLTAPRIGIAGGALVRGNVQTEGEPAVSPARRAHSAAGLRPTAFTAKPQPRTETKSAPIAAAPDSEPPEPAPALKPAKELLAERRPPAPVVPSLGKGAKAKKKSRDA